MIEHLPILPILVPLLSAPLCMLVRHRLAVRTMAAVVAWISFGCCLALLHATRAGDVFSYRLGGWLPPVGIEIRATLATSFVGVVVSGVAALVVIFGARDSDDSRLTANRRYLYYAAYLLCLAGLLGMTFTADVFNVFVFLEISSLATYSLISMGKERRALLAAFSYLIMGTLGGTFYLLGVGMLYARTGTLNIADLAARLPAEAENRAVIMGVAFVVVGLAIKLAVFPLHQWLPNAYTYAPPKVSAFIAGTATKVSYWVLVRMLFLVLGAGLVFDRLHLDLLLMPLSLLAMFIGSLAAIYQTDLRRLLAYSSIAQIGYMTLGLSLANVDGLTGGLVHMFNHGVTKSAMFLAVAGIGFRVGSTQVNDLRGLGRRMPLSSLALVIGGLSLIGVPGTAGFVSKWYLVLGAFERGWTAVAVLILLSSLLAVVYVWRIVETAYFRPRPEEGGGRTGDEVSEVSLRMLVPTVALMTAVIVFGFWTPYTAGVAAEVAGDLLGALP